jgi:hypothetical protein
MQGHYARTTLLHDGVLKARALSFIRENSQRKGEPNLRIIDFQSYVNGEMKHRGAGLFKDYTKEDQKKLLAAGRVQLPISEQTALNWMHALGCKYRASKKQLYYDEHDREDVTADRKDRYIPAMTEYMKRMRLYKQLDPADEGDRAIHVEAMKQPKHPDFREVTVSPIPQLCL